MKNTDVSVIIPAHNSEWCLADCLESISNQTKKPLEVLIGVDACKDTLVAANKLQAKYARKRAISDRLFIRIFEFPEHSYPYIIRNTLACLARGGILCFFDADDLMYEKHIETMAGGVKRGAFVTAKAEITENGCPKTKWDNAHGVISISKLDFLSVGGFEPWICAADTESRQRFSRIGLVCRVPKEPTMLVRKHDNGLTRTKETGYGSHVRNGYSSEIKRRISEGDWGPISLTCGKCVEWIGKESGVFPVNVKSNKPKYANELVVMSQAIPDEKHPETPVKVIDRNRCPGCGAKVPLGRERPFICGICYGPVV